MKKIAVLLLFAIPHFCVAQKALLRDEKERLSIPANSPCIEVVSPMSADSLFYFVEKTLGDRGWIVKSSKGAFQVSCDGREVYNKVYLKPFVRIESLGESSKAVFSAVWAEKKATVDRINFFIGPFDNSPQKVTWQGYKTHPGIAYQALAIIAKKIPRGTVSYLPPR